jgi:hypothetical protein
LCERHTDIAVQKLGEIHYQHRYKVKHPPQAISHNTNHHRNEEILSKYFKISKPTQRKHKGHYGINIKLLENILS